MLRFLLLCALASGTELMFQYQQFHRNNEPCKICYGDNCLQMDQIRCEYYVETDGILQEEELEGEDNPEIRAEVDRMMYKFMEKATATLTECIPLVSQYTDCTKENICIGCNTCNCDINGNWNCTTVNKCRADISIEVDHRMLVFVMENLMKDSELFNLHENKRAKRNIKENLNKMSKNKISFDEISQWMFEDAPLTNVEEPTLINAESTNSNTNNTTTGNIEITTQAVNLQPETTSSTDYLGFDEVLNNIAVDSEIYSRRKTLDIVHNDSVAFDYMLFDDHNNIEAVTEKLECENMDSKYTPSNIDGETKIVLDLLESAKKNQGETFSANWTENTETDKINAIDPTLDYIDNYVLSSKNEMKRDIQINGQITEISTEKVNITNNVKELRNSVLVPLSNIINDKQKELDALLQVSENLIKIMRSYKNQTNFEPSTHDDNISSSMSIYNFEIAPELENNFRSSDSNLLHKYVIKLKRDIYEVIRDIAGIQKLKGSANIPQDLKILLRSMKHYVRSQAKPNDNVNKSASDITNHRRKTNNTTNDSNKISLVNEITDIFKVLDQKLPENNALASLSPTSRRIIYRIIKNNYVNEFAVVGLRVFDPEYNLTKDLSKIGTEWPRMTNTTGLSVINDRLHAMKLLHLVLSTDIIKMKNALALLDFAFNRRMILVEGNLGGKIMNRINKGLKAINEKIKIIIKLHNNKHVNEKKVEISKKDKKESFLKKLKNILKTSKSDIINMLKKKVPKKEIVKGLAKKKIDEIASRRLMEFEDTMKKWQNKLNLVPRDKRAARDDNYKNQMKNILPKYLRGKVKPGITAKRSKKMNRKQRKQNKLSETTTTTKANFK